MAADALQNLRKLLRTPLFQLWKPPREFSGLRLGQWSQVLLVDIGLEAGKRIAARKEDLPALRDGALPDEAALVALLLQDDPEERRSRLTIFSRFRFGSWVAS